MILTVNFLSDLSHELRRQTDLKVVNLFKKSSFSELNLILQKFFNFIVRTFIRKKLLSFKHSDS